MATAIGQDCDAQLGRKAIPRRQTDWRPVGTECLVGTSRTYTFSPARSLPGRIDERPQVEKVGSQVLSLRQLGRSGIFSARTCWQLSPVAAAISHLSSGLLIGRDGSFFSEWPIYLRSSGLCGFGTVLEIRTFREAYEFYGNEVLQLLSDRREHPISNSPYRGSNPGAPAIHSRLRPSFPRNARMGRKSRLSGTRFRLRTPGAPVLRWKVSESLQPPPRIFPFCGD